MCFRTSITTMAPDVGLRIIPPRHEENASNPDEQPEVQVPEPKVKQEPEVQQEPEDQKPEPEQVTTETVTLTTDTATTVKDVEPDVKISERYMRRKQKPFVMVDPDLDDERNH